MLWWALIYREFCETNFISFVDVPRSGIIWYFYVWVLSCGTFVLFFTKTMAVYIPTNCVQGLQFLCFLARAFYLLIFLIDSLTDVRQCFIILLIWSSLMISHVEFLLIYLVTDVFFEQKKGLFRDFVQITYLFWFWGYPQHCLGISHGAMLRNHYWQILGDHRIYWGSTPNGSVQEILLADVLSLHPHFKFIQLGF